MKKITQALCLVLALILLASALIACDSGTEETTTQASDVTSAPEVTTGSTTEPDATTAAETSAEATTAAPATLKLNGADISEYVVVFNKSAASGGESAYNYLNSKLGELYGVTLSKSTAIKDRYEILIALDGGDTAIADAYKNCTDGFLGVSGKKIFIMGSNAGALQGVINRLLEKAEGTDTAKEIVLSANEEVKQKKEALKVLTYNVQEDITKAGRASTCLADMAALITEQDPDVFGTQENTTNVHAGLSKYLTGYSYYRGAQYNTSSWLGDYVYWKTDKFTVEEKGYRYMSDTPKVMSKYEGSNGYRGFTYIILKSNESGITFLFVDTHTDYRSTDDVRAAQLKVLTAFLKEEKYASLPTIILGDFNATPGAGSITSFKDDNPLIKPTLDVAEVKENLGGTLAVKEFSTREAYVFDYVFITTDKISAKYYAEIDKKLNGRYPSDHLPVVAHLEVFG